MDLLQSLIPSDLTVRTLLTCALCFFLVLLVCGLIIRLVLGKKSDLNRALSTTLGVLLVYAVSVLIYMFKPGILSGLLSPLPFVRLSGNHLMLLSLTGSDLPAVSREMLSLVILIFLCSMVDEIFPERKRLPGWLCLRLLIVLLTLVVYYLVHVLLGAMLPNFWNGYGPMILLSILLFMVALGSLKLLLNLVLFSVNPVIGALYGFFFGHRTGKQLSRAVLTTLILCGLLQVLERLGIHTIPLSPEALGSSLPMLAVLLTLWYVLDCVL